MPALYSTCLAGVVLSFCINFFSSWHSKAFWVIAFTEDPPSTGSDVEKQLLEAARSGDMEVVKVKIEICDG